MRRTVFSNIEHVLYAYIELFTGGDRAMYMRHNASFAEVMTDLNEYDRVSSDTTCREKPHREWCNERPQRYCVVALFT